MSSKRSFEIAKSLLFKQLESMPPSPPSPPSNVDTFDGGVVDTATPDSNTSGIKTRIKLFRILDDGRQTLGIMQVYDENGNELYELKSVELPYINNRNSISCVPPGKYLIRPRQNDHYGKHFHLVGNEEGNFKSIPNTNTSARTYVLIHKAPNSTWLAGCIGPGTKFNSNVSGREIKDKYGSGGRAGNVQGNPYGMISKEDSEKGLNKLRDTLWKQPFNENEFYMIIQNNPSGLVDKKPPGDLNELRIGGTSDPVI